LSKLETYYRGKLVVPVYTFIEYPKWITTTDGQSVVVNTKEEEIELTKPKRGRPKNDSTSADDTFGHNQPSTENG